MVSQNFVLTLNKCINKNLKDIIRGEVQMLTHGSNIAYEKNFLPFYSATYTAHEYLQAIIPVNDPHLNEIHFVTPVLNVGKDSVQGIATFLAHVPYTITETYVERMVGISSKLLPYDLIVNKGMKPKEVIKGNLIKSKAILSINNDQSLNPYLYASNDGSVTAYKQKYKFDLRNYPPGSMTVVPYNGHTLIIIKDAGGWAVVDNPSYMFSSRFKGLSGVAKYIAMYPEESNNNVGVIHTDNSMNILSQTVLNKITNK